MTVKTGTAWAGTFVTQDATGALATPSTGPAGVLYVDGTANAAEVTITGTNPYKFAVTLPALTAGQRVDMYITATIATIATAGVVASEQADTALTSEVKTETAAILADTGTDGVLVSSGTGAKQISLDSGKVLLQATQTGVTIPTVTTLTNLPAVTTDWLTADGVKADAVTKIQANLALEATLTAMKGAGWNDETLVAIDVLIDAIKAKTDLIPASPAPANEYDARMAAIQADLDNPAQYKADVSGLATAVNLATVDGKADAIKLKTDLIPASPAPANEYDVRMTAIQADLDNADQYKADVSGVPEAVMTAIVEGVITLRDSLKIANALLAGKTSGGGSGTVIFRDLADTLNRVIAVVDANNNRTTITRDLT